MNFLFIFPLPQSIYFVQVFLLKNICCIINIITVVHSVWKLPKMYHLNFRAKIDKSAENCKKYTSFLLIYLSLLLRLFLLLNKLLYAFVNHSVWKRSKMSHLNFRAKIQRLIEITIIWVDTKSSKSSILCLFLKS